MSNQAMSVVTSINTRQTLRRDKCPCKICCQHIMSPLKQVEHLLGRRHVKCITGVENRERLQGRLVLCKKVPIATNMVLLVLSNDRESGMGCMWVEYYVVPVRVRDQCQSEVRPTRANLEWIRARTLPNKQRMVIFCSRHFEWFLGY